MIGKWMTVDEVFAEVEQDGPFFAESGGGITVSGGECLLSPDFVAALLEEAHSRGINALLHRSSTDRQMSPPEKRRPVLDPAKLWSVLVTDTPAILPDLSQTCRSRRRLPHPQLV
jgi:pyruvate-formate lyase-activating enzyme